MKPRLLKDIKISLTEIDKREKLVNSTMLELINSGARIVTYQSIMYGLTPMSTPQFLLTSIVYEKVQAEEGQPVARKRFIKQVTTPLLEIEKRADTINQACEMLAEKGAKIVNFQDTVFGMTPAFAPQYLVTDIIYEADEEISIETSVSAPSKKK